MTREEAIEILNRDDDSMRKGYFCINDFNAIEVLKSQDSVLDQIKAEIKEWYWQADKQALAEDPCVVDAMIDLFIRTIDKYKAGEE